VNFPAYTVTHTRSDKVRVLKNPTQLEALIQEAGIHSETHVVIYGERGGQDAAFLFWALELAGLKRLSFLDGGVEAWVRAGHSLTQDVPEGSPSSLSVSLDAQRYVTGDWLLAHLNDADVQIVDNRTLAEYTGEEALALRGGHIPGALRFEWIEGLTPELTFKSSEELKRLFTAAGVLPDKALINYCQSGARSAHVALAMRLAGWKDVRVYEASWSEWGNNERFPVEVGAFTAKPVFSERSGVSESLDLRGELCPYTLIYTKKKMSELSPNTALEVLIDNEDATQTIPTWAEQAGHRVLELERVEQGWKIVLMRAN
jgi:thiosulfate/3-mercaptopyruvate sulfurtransferase